MRKAPRGGRLREAAPVGGVDLKGTRAILHVLDVAFSADDARDAEPTKMLEGSRLDRSNLFGSNGPRPWI